MQALLFLLNMILIVLIGAALLVVGLAVAIAVPLGLALVGVLLLQLAGVLKKVPFSYNLRNLVVRWKTTALSPTARPAWVGAGGPPAAAAGASCRCAASRTR